MGSLFLIQRIFPPRNELRSPALQADFLPAELPGKSIYIYIKAVGFPGETSGKEHTSQCWRHKRCGFNPWAGKILWRRKWQPNPVFLPRESHGQRSLAGYTVHGVTKSWMQLKRLSTHVHTHEAKNKFMCQFLVSNLGYSEKYLYPPFSFLIYIY